MLHSSLSLRILCPVAGLGLILVPILASQSQPVSKSSDTVDAGYRETVQPFLKSYCTSCHGGEMPKADLNLTTFTSPDAVAKDLRRWMMVLEHLDAGSMPPGKAKEQPSAEMRGKVVAWIRALRQQEAKRNAGDPGPVPARRLSNAEYDYTIRDLVGVDLKLAQTFPVDPANEAGFDNSAESLAVPPALLDKYLEASRKVSEHLIFETDGLVFAQYPVVPDTDRDKFSVRRIIDFYKKQRTDYADYFQAAWRYQHRDKLGQPKATLAEIAAKEGISPKYLATIWSTLTGPPEEVGPIAALRALWKSLPSPESKEASVRSGCVQMRDLVVKVRAKLVPEVKNLTAPGMNNGSQPLVLWKNRQMAANRMRYAGGGLKLKLDALAPAKEAARPLATPDDPLAAKQFEAALAAFCKAFPDAFYISERARVYLDQEREKKLAGRLLSAGLHSMTGYFRDDGPLYDLMLSADEQKELDRLWLDFDVVTGAPMRQYTSFIWFERSDSSFMRGTEFNIFRAEDKDCTTEAKIKQLAKVYLDKARNRGANATAQQAIKDHFEIISTQIRRVEKARLAAEPKHLESLQAFAERAYRRPLSKPQRDNLLAFYRTLRDKDGLGHEDAIRDTLVTVLLSPHFLFRAEPVSAGKGITPLSDYALASRLSYFLWVTMPDAELLAHAKAGDLRQPEVLRAQVLRMVKDERIRGLAVEFAGNWLDFRRFEEHNAVDRARFKSFTDDLRKAMFEEPIHFFMDVARADRPILDFVFARHTFVNPSLAKHYGMPVPNVASDEWVRVDDAHKFERGGLLPMAVFQTKNAPGLRTSPVKRGYWVVRRVLGEKIPAPPAEVPELPSDEAKLDLPLRDVLARHRADKACAGCHARFDSVGLAFEGFGPIGELRKVDLAGRKVETSAVFPGGGEGTGLDGLRTYLRDRRQNDFLDNFCRQLLAYGLGRTLIPSDDGLIDEMRQRLTANDHRFGVALEAIVTSPQFLNRRARVGSLSRARSVLAE